MVTRWKFTDPEDATELVFARNPESGDGTEPAFKRNVLIQTTSPTHEPILVESGTADQDINLKGVLLSTAERDAVLAFVNKDRRVLWDNDVGDQHWIYIDSFVPTRKKRVSHTYVADYTLHALILE